jgi:hypothetical protein
LQFSAERIGRQQVQRMDALHEELRQLQERQP